MGVCVFKQCKQTRAKEEEEEKERIYLVAFMYMSLLLGV